jgi:GDPmannose 4,6-dehydratase
VREFCELAFAHAGLDYRDWVKEGTADLRRDGRGPLVGNAARARDVLGWRPVTDFGALVRLMVDASIATLASRNITS